MRLPRPPSLGRSAHSCPTTLPLYWAATVHKTDDVSNIQWPPFCAVDVDDILIYSQSKEEHQNHMRSSLQLLEDNSLIMSSYKCIFCVFKVGYLGHEVSVHGLRSQSCRCQTPTTVKGLHEFIGMVNCSHIFLPCHSNHTGTTIQGPDRKVFEGTTSNNALVTPQNRLWPMTPCCHSHSPALL